MDSKGKVQTENNKKQCTPDCVLCSNEWILSANRKREISSFALSVNTGISPA